MWKFIFSQSMIALPCAAAQGSGGGIKCVTAGGESGFIRWRRMGTDRSGLPLRSRDKKRFGVMATGNRSQIRRARAARNSL